MTPPNTKVCCPDCKRPLGDVIESLVRQRGRFKGQREKARAELEQLRDKVGLLANEAAKAVAHPRHFYENEGGQQQMLSKAVALARSAAMTKEEA